VKWDPEKVRGHSGTPWEARSVPCSFSAKSIGFTAETAWLADLYAQTGEPTAWESPAARRAARNLEVGGERPPGASWRAGVRVKAGPRRRAGILDAVAVGGRVAHTVQPGVSA
jgi:hypothetical protein